MASYSLQIKPSALKELDALEDVVFARIDSKILSLAETPRPIGCKKLKGFKDLWRVRQGDHRIVYSVDDRARVVNIVRIAHRREVYE